MLNDWRFLLFLGTCKIISSLKHIHVILWRGAVLYVYRLNLEASLRYYKEYSLTYIRSIALLTWVRNKWLELTERHFKNLIRLRNTYISPLKWPARLPLLCLLSANPPQLLAARKGGYFRTVMKEEETPRTVITGYRVTVMGTAESCNGDSTAGCHCPRTEHAQT